MIDLSIQETFQSIENGMRVGRAPRLAILGPPGSDKTQFLKRLRRTITTRYQPAEARTLAVDLHAVPIGSLNRMYQVINSALLTEADNSGIPVDFDPEDQHHQRRFPHILRWLIKNVEGCLILFIDHLDSVPRYFARDLSYQLRDLLEKSDQQHDSKRLGVIVAGTISLIELRREVESPILMFDITLLPSTDSRVRRHLVEEGLRAFEIENASLEVINLLAHETGGESNFLDLLLKYIPNPRKRKKLPLNPALIQAAIDKIIVSQDVDVLRHLAFHLWGDEDLRDIVRDLKDGNVVRRRQVTSDTDRFHLHGAVIASRDYPSSFEAYRFRNGIVERFLKLLLSFLEDDTVEARNLPIVSELRALEEIEASCVDSQSIWSCVEYLLHAWKFLTPYSEGQPLINFYITNRESHSGWWLDVEAKAVARMELREEPPEAVRRAAFYAVRSLPSAVGITAEGFNVSFGHDDQHVSLGIPLPWRNVRVVLLTTLKRGVAGNEYTEFTLNHWIRFIHELKQTIAILALAQLGQKLVLEELQGKDYSKIVHHSDSRSETDADRSFVKQVFWVPHYGAIISEAGTVSTLPGRMSDSVIEDINGECLELVNQTTNSKKYNETLARISRQFVRELAGIPNLYEKITSNAPLERLIITTDIEGLKLPFEILPYRNKSYLSLERPVARQISEIQLGPSPHHSFQQMFSSLIEVGGKLRVLLVASEAGGELPESGKELEAVKKHIEVGCKRINLEVEFEELVAAMASVGQLERVLTEGRPYHLFHFVGHASHFLNDQSASGIILAGEHGQPEVVSCQGLRHWFEGAGLWFAYLSSCYGSAVSGSAAALAQTYTGVIEALITGGVPNVLGFRWAVTDTGALSFAFEFYRHLFELQGGEKDLLPAIHHARRSTQPRPDCIDAWASSVLVTQL